MDTFGEGFHFTNIDDGVKFRVVPDGPLYQMSWPDSAWRNGWLALDRNDNGTIDSLSELFGNVTAQPASDHPNGYLALAVFDDPANGGNDDGFIDASDSVYEHLRVWIDSNHDGVSQPAELHTLKELGIFRIGLKYRLSTYVDANGNAFRYKGRLWDLNQTSDERTYDVFIGVRQLSAAPQ